MGLNFIASADWHLQGMLSVFEDPLPYQMAEIQKPYSYAMEHGIKNVFVPGDISDVETMTERTMTHLIGLLLKFPDIDTYYIPGNHDTASKGVTSLNFLSFLTDHGLFKNFKIFFKPTVVRLDGVNVAFMPWPSREVPTCKSPPLVLAHVEQPGALGDNGLPLRVKEEPLDRQPGDYVVSGHIHQHQHLKKKRFVYTGSLYQKNFGESLPKGFLSGQANVSAGKLNVDIEFVRSRPAFVLETIQVSRAADLKQLKADPLIRYKIVVDKQSGVILPADITSRFPNIVSILGSGGVSKSAIEALRSQTNDVPKFGPLTGLRKFCIGLGLDDKTASLAVSIAKELVQEVRR